MDDYLKWLEEYKQICLDDGYEPNEDYCERDVQHYYSPFFMHGWSPMKTFVYHDRDYKGYPEDWYDDNWRINE